MKGHFDILLKLGVIVLLMVGVITNQSHNFYGFLRWMVFVTSIYFAYRSQQVSIFAVVVFVTISTLFNPFREFYFRKEIWHGIDFAVCVFIILTIDWKSYVNNLSPKGKLIFSLIKHCSYGLLALIVAVWFVGGLIKVNPYDEYRLITRGVTTNGFITNAEEYEDEVQLPDSQGGGAKTVTNVYYKYQFTTQDGSTITDASSELGGIEDFKGKPISIQIEFLPDNPQINRVKDATSQCKTLIEFLWRRVGLGMLMLILFCSVGFQLIRKAINDYLSANKKLQANEV